MSVVVRVDPDLCIGTGDCVRIAPRAFRIDPATAVSVAQPGAAATDRALLEEAAFTCPTRAITVEGAA